MEGCPDRQVLVESWEAQRPKLLDSNNKFSDTSPHVNNVNSLNKHSSTLF